MQQTVCVFEKTGPTQQPGVGAGQGAAANAWPRDTTPSGRDHVPEIRSDGGGDSSGGTRRLPPVLEYTDPGNPERHGHRRVSWNT